MIACGTGAAVIYSLWMLVRGAGGHLYFESAGMIIALILFIMLKAINGATEKAKKLAKKKEEEEAAKPAEDPADIKLLKEMVAILKEQNPEAAKKAEDKLKKEAEAKK